MDAGTRRHLLQTTAKYDVVVAKDGSGQYKTIQAAVNAYKVNKNRVVIYIKAGVYNEQVIVPKKAESLTFVGDGDSTVITGNRNVALMKGMTTFLSATLSKSKLCTVFKIPLVFQDPCSSIFNPSTNV